MRDGCRRTEATLDVVRGSIDQKSGRRSTGVGKREAIPDCLEIQTLRKHRCGWLEAHHPGMIDCPGRAGLKQCAFDAVGVVIGARIRIFLMRGERELLSAHCKCEQQDV